MVKKIVFGLLAAIITTGVFANNAQSIPNRSTIVYVKDEAFGSGAPGTRGYTKATRLPGGIYFVPQYLPGNPTAGVVYPRVINVPCKVGANNTLYCDGFHWLPSMGQGQFLFVQPVIVHAKKPIIVVVKQTRTILKEVPIKKIHQ